MFIQLPGTYSQQTGSITVDPGESKIFQFPIFGPIFVRPDQAYINESRLFNAEIPVYFTSIEDVQAINPSYTASEFYDADLIEPKQYIEATEFYDAIPFYDIPMPESGAIALGPIGFAVAEALQATDGSLPPSFVLPIPNDIEPGIPICNTFVSAQRELWSTFLDANTHYKPAYFDITGDIEQIVHDKFLDSAYSVELAIPFFKLYKLILEASTKSLGLYEIHDSTYAVANVIQPLNGSFMLPESSTIFPPFGFVSGYSATDVINLSSRFISIET